MAPVLVKKPRAVQEEIELDAELRKKLVKQRLEEGRQELRDGKIIWLR